jgi:beta-glucosidase
VRLLGFERVDLEPGESRRVTVTADPRLLARFDTGTGQWRTSEGAHTIAVGRNAQDLVLDAKATLGGRAFGT